MQVELLVVAGCPNEQPALHALRQAARQAGLGEVEVVRRVVATQDEAELLGFFGSPTFAVEGRDLFAAPGAASGLTCRVYPTPAGPAGLPPVADLSEALLRAT